MFVITEISDYLKFRNDFLKTLYFLGLGNVGHAEDLLYIIFSDRFENSKNEELFPPSDIVTRRRLVKLLSNFMKYM